MIKICRQLKCEHKYYKVSEFEQDICVNSYKTHLVRKIVVYCPICKKEKVLRTLDYEIMLNKRKVDKEYKNGTT